MDVMRLRGGTPLNGTVAISGAKNAALPILAATLLTRETCHIEGVPDLSDIRFMAEILRHIGVEVSSDGNGNWSFQAKEISHVAPYDLVRKMRASICLLGPMISRLRKARISIPGGCVIGPRPIDLHLKGLTALGCKVSIDAGYVDVDGSRLKGDYLFLGGRHGSTVTGTANMVMAAVLAPGITRLESAAVEPEVVDLCRMLVKMGARIEGIGSHYLRITGVEALHGCTHRVTPDRIEAGTYLVAGAITRGKVSVSGVVVGHMRALLSKFEEANIAWEADPDAGTISVDGAAKERTAIEIITLPHPGFPTDLQAQMLALMSITPGLSIITERIYPNRFMHVPELMRMGADVSMEGPNAVIKGVPKLSGAPVMASDLRASAALVLAGLAAEGETWVQRLYHLDRGYDRLDIKLQALGADAVRLPETDLPSDLLED